MNETINWQTAAGADSLALAGTSDGISEFGVNGQPLVQVRTAVRASAARPINRGNLFNRVSFVVTYTPAASVLAAKQAVATKTAGVLAELPDHALLKGVFGALTWQLADAALDSYAFTYRGMTVFGRFAFIGGAYTAA